MIEIYYNLAEKSNDSDSNSSYFYIDQMVELLVSRKRESYIKPQRLLKFCADRNLGVKFVKYYKWFIEINVRLRHNRVDFRSGEFEEFNRLFRIYSTVEG